LGQASVGDKTLVDAVTPFAQVLSEQVRSGAPLRSAWQCAEAAADVAAQATANLVPRKGRARPLAERSVGTPDPGAVSFVICAKAVGLALFTRERAHA
jgi:dihydroxyacetone kinase